MIHVKPSEARKRWFELLDMVVAGDVVVMERAGHRIVLRAEPMPPDDALKIPDYSDLKGDIDNADKWGWEWTDKGLVPIDLP